MALDHFDVTRNTTKTVLNAQGVLETVPANVPAFEFNPDGTYKGCLIEPASTNKVERSENFADAFWDKINIDLTSNFAIAPDGTETADLIDVAVSGTSRISKNFDASDFDNDTDYTISCFFKAQGSNRVGIRARDNDDTGCAATFDIENGAVVFEQNAVGKIIPYPNGWFRCIMTYNSGTGTETGLDFRFIQLLPPNFDGNISASDPGDSVLAWGVQFEEGSVATSYIPTTDSAATRNSDVIAKTGASGLIGQDEGSLYAEIDINKFLPSNELRTVVGIKDARIFINGTAIVSRSLSAGVGSLLMGINKIVVTYTNNFANYKLYANGVDIGSETGSAQGIIDSIGVGSRHLNGDRFLNDHIRSVALYKRALTQSEAEALTS